MDSMGNRRRTHTPCMARTTKACGPGTAPTRQRAKSSGTSWQPDAAPPQGIHARFGAWDTMTHGFANLIYDDQGGPRGDTKTFMTSMLMVMAQRAVGEAGRSGCAR